MSISLLVSLCRLDRSMVGDWRGSAFATMVVATLKILRVWCKVFSLRGEVECRNRQHPFWQQHFPIFQGWETKLLPEWFWSDCTAFKLKVLLKIWQWCHRARDTWMRAGSENHPHHTLKFDHFCHAIFSYAVQFSKANQRSRLSEQLGGVEDHIATLWGDIYLRCQIKKEDWTIVIKR